jgi:hypothetical protein
MGGTWQTSTPGQSAHLLDWPAIHAYYHRGTSASTELSEHGHVTYASLVTQVRGSMHGHRLRSGRRNYPRLLGDDADNRASR